MKKKTMLEEKGNVTRQDILKLIDEYIKKQNFWEEFQKRSTDDFLVYLERETGIPRENLYYSLVIADPKTYGLQFVMGIGNEYVDSVYGITDFSIFKHDRLKYMK